MRPPVRKTTPMMDGALGYLEWENAGPVLHFAHANGFNAETYKSLLAPLANRFHIYAADQRGHGFSTLPAPPGFAKGWTAFRDDLIRFLEQLGGEPKLLAGHSLGGAASLMAAAARPDLVRGLILIEPVFVPAMMFRLYRLFIATGLGRPKVVDFVERATKRRDMFESVAAAEAAYRGNGAFKSWPAEMVHDYVAGGTLPAADGRVRLACAPRVEAEGYAGTPGGIYRLAGKVRCPVTLIRGENPGSTCRPQEAAAVSRLKPNTRIVTVAGAGHFLPMERRDIVRDEIVRMAEHLSHRPASLQQANSL